MRADPLEHNRAVQRIEAVAAKWPTDMQHLLRCSLAKARCDEVQNGTLDRCVSLHVCGSCGRATDTQLWPNEGIFSESTGMCTGCLESKYPAGEGDAA